MQRIPVVILVIFVFTSVASSQTVPARELSAQESISAEMKYGPDAKYVYDRSEWEALAFTTESEPVYATPKSPLLAGILSAVVPGSGDIYAENYIMAGVFLAAEAIGWYYHIDQNTKGDDQTAYYQQFADTHWSAVRYAEWLNAYADKFDHEGELKKIPINPDESLPPWERVDWNIMNEVELSVPVFSHRLPQHGAQQYFELIGKYHQYTYGWDDKKVEGDVTIEYRKISNNFAYYSGERGKANDFYNTATTITNLIIINHVLAAANAIWSAARFNNDIELYSHVELIRVGYSRVELVPTATFRFRF